MNKEYIRNFCIISHVDHGKSTLCDRMLEITGTIAKNKMRDQMLDQMDIERERGITIKLQPVQMSWKGFILNLIDTPGHVDFNYEVSRSLAAVEGAILLVDATQGIQAQTIHNFQLALEAGLHIIPVVNKIDLPSANVDESKRSLIDTFGFKEEEIIVASGKIGTNIDLILDRIIQSVPAPHSSGEKLQALIFDSQYDQFKGVIAYIRVVSGTLHQGEPITFMGNKTNAHSSEVGIFKPTLTETGILESGYIGYVATGLKNVSLCHVGDTITHTQNPADYPLEGYQESAPMVFAAFYPIDPNDFENLREALGKLQLTDGALVYEPENSTALGSGFRCGFLGLLHLEIVQERLHREYNLNLIASSPTVKYQVHTTSGEELEIDSPSKLPPPTTISLVREPWVAASVTTPTLYMGSILELINQKRGVVSDMHYMGERVAIQASLPLSEIIIDFFDTLKSLTAGYGSLDYELLGYKETHVSKLQILVNNEPVDALSCIVPTEHAVVVGRKLAERLKNEIPRSQFEIAIQAAINGKIIARETVSAFRKDVIAKLYGGDVTRKNKLLDKQKEGKKKMKMIGRVEIPQEAFLAVLRNSSS